MKSHSPRRAYVFASESESELSNNSVAMRLLWGLLWLTKVWASSPRPPSAFVVVCPSSRKSFNDVFNPGTDDFNAAASHRPQARSIASNGVGAYALDFSARSSQYSDPTARCMSLCMSGDQTHEKNGRRIRHQRKGDEDSPPVQTQQTDANESLGIDFVRLVTMLTQSSRGKRSEQSTSSRRSFDEISETSYKGAEQLPKKVRKKTDSRLLVTKPISVSSGAARDEPVVSLPWRWLRAPWRRRGIVVVEARQKNSVADVGTNPTIAASASSAGRALASVQRSPLPPSTADADEIGDDQGEKEGKLVTGTISSILKLGWLWSQERSSQPSLPPRAADDCDEINPRETKTKTKTQGDDEGLVFETILSMVKLGWPWSEQVKNDAASPPVSIATAQSQVESPRNEEGTVGGEQDGEKESGLTSMLSVVKLAWPWSQVASDDEQRSEVDGRELSTQLPDSPSPSVVLVASEKASKRWWSFLYWGRAREYKAEGRTSRQPKEVQIFSRDPDDQQGQTDGISGPETFESLPSPSIRTPDRERAVPVNSLVNAPFALPNRGRYSRIKVAVTRPVSIIRNSLRRAAGVASVLPAVSVSSMVGALKPVASFTMIPVPPAASLIGNINADNPSFPVRVPLRPPGYRWGASLLSKRRTASRRKLVKSNNTREDLDQDLRDPLTLAAAEEPSSGSDAQMDRRATLGKLEIGVRGTNPRRNISTAKSRLINKLRLSIKKARSGSAEGEKEGTDPVSDWNMVEDWAGVEVVKASDGQRADPGIRPRGVPWWQAGAAVLVGVGAALYRPVVNRLLSISAEVSPRDDASSPGLQNFTKLDVDESAVPFVTEAAVANPATMQPNVGAVAAAELGLDNPTIRSTDAVATTDSDSDSEMDGSEQDVAPADSPRRPVLRGLTRAALSRVKTTSRRARLWALLRRRSMARAKPLLPEMDTGISTLSVPLTSPENLSSSAGEPAAELPQASVVQEADKLLSPTALVESSQNASQALGGSGWNLFAFFPKEKDDGEKNMAGTETVTAATKDSASTMTQASPPMEPLEGSANSTNEETQASTWPKSAWVQGLDPRAQIEAAMAQYLRSALGYGGSGLMEPAMGVTNETLAAAAAAAGDAAVLEGQKQLEGKAGFANAAALEDEKLADEKNMGPTARYLGDLSPLSEEETGAGWSGAEAAAAAAGAAAGAAMDAAGVAAGVAADVAAAATAATLNVAAPFGQVEDEEEGWQVSGSRKRGKDKDDGEFGEGKLGVRPRKLDPRKAHDMIIDPVSTNSLRRSVASDNQIQRHRPPGARLLSAAMKRSRLPRRWKSTAAAAASTAPTPLIDVDMQEITLRRLGRVGVAEIASSMLLIASETASQIDSVEELEQFREEGGMPRLLMALSPTPYTTKANGLAAIRNLLRVSPESVAAEILETAGVEALFELRRLVGSPGEPWSSAAARAAAAATDSLDAMRLQAEAVQLLQELSLASHEALSKVGELPNLIPALSAIAYPGSGPLGTLRDKIGRSLGGVSSMTGSGGRVDVTRRAEEAISAQAVSGASKLLSMLGIHNWRPRQPGQKGLRILSLDGGGTRGVLTIALLREVLKGFDKDVHEVFDVICGTSTGGILAMLFASEKQSLASATAMYDSLVVKIFRKDLLANAKLVLWQAQYSSTEWEAILEDILGDRRMIDTMNNPENPRVVICSTIMNVNPLEMMLWRNYGYRPGQEPVYKGDYRRKIRECVRATTAAPSFFTPLMDGEMMYADGAFMANNPTSIAVTEAKLLFPDVPIECVLSVGTGYYPPQPSKAGMSWNTVVNQLVNSATDTEGIDATLKTFLPPSQYFRFNPSIKQFDIDEIRPERLNELKSLAKEYVARPEIKARAEELRRVLRGESSSSWPSVVGGGGGYLPREEDTSSSVSPASRSDDGEDIERPR